MFQSLRVCCCALALQMNHLVQVVPSWGFLVPAQRSRQCSQTESFLLLLGSYCRNSGLSKRLAPVLFLRSQSSSWCFSCSLILQVTYWDYRCCFWNRAWSFEQYFGRPSSLRASSCKFYFSAPFFSWPLFPTPVLPSKPNLVSYTSLFCGWDHLFVVDIGVWIHCLKCFHLTVCH